MKIYSANCEHCGAFNVYKNIKKTPAGTILLSCLSCGKISVNPIIPGLEDGQPSIT